MGEDVRVGMTGAYECREAAQRERQTGILGSPCAHTSHENPNSRACLLLECVCQILLRGSTCLVALMSVGMGHVMWRCVV